MVTIGTLNGGNITITTGPATRAETRIWWSNNESNYTDYPFEGTIDNESLLEYDENGTFATAYKIEIGNTVTVIYDYTFSWCSSITSIMLPNSVTSIGNGAFGNCTNLTDVTIPDSVTSIGEDALQGCTGLTSVTFEGKDKATVKVMTNYPFGLD